jgi:hypothetical protein
MLFQSSATTSRLAGGRLNPEGSHGDSRVLFELVCQQY